MIPFSKRYIPPSERPPNAPTKKEIDDLVTDHIGGYTKREIKRLSEIHKHFVNFHYEPQSSDGGLIADDGTDPLYYYQSNLPVIQRLMSSRHLRKEEDEDDAQDSDDQDEETLATNMEERMQELRDGVANNAYVAVEKGKLSGLISIQKSIARNLQDTNAVVAALQDNKELFDVDEEELRIVGRGSQTLQLELMQTLLKFRRDQVNQLKRLMQCMVVKVSDMSTAIEQASPTPAAQRRGVGRARMAVNAVTAALRATSDPSKPRSSEGDSFSGDVDLDLLRDLANEVQYLRREQEYMYYRLYGMQKKPDPVAAAGNDNTSGSKLQGPPSKGLSSAISAATASSSPGKTNRQAPGQPRAPNPRGAGGSRLANAIAEQPPIESHPDYPQLLQKTEKAMRVEMEKIYQKMVEAESAKLFVHATKGAETLKRLMSDVEQHKQMIESVHHHVIGIFEPGRMALKTCHILENVELAKHDVLALTRPLERALTVRSVKEYEGESSSIGKALQSLESRDLSPVLSSQALNAIEVFAGELVRVGDPISEDALDRASFTIGYASDALKHVAMKCCGSMLTIVSSLAPQWVTQECAETVLKLLRVLIPQWTEEAMTKLAIDVAEKDDVFHVVGALAGIKERNIDLRRLCRQSRGSSRHRSRNTSRGADNGGDVFLEGEPLPDLGEETDEEESEAEEPRVPSRGSTRSKQSSTPVVPSVVIVQCHQESQCEIMRWHPPSARSESSDDRAAPLSQRSGSALNARRRSTTPLSARSGQHPEFVGDDAFTQTEVVPRKADATQTDVSSFSETASPNANTGLASRTGSARVHNPSPLSSSLSRPVSAMKFANPRVERGNGEKAHRMIPKSGALVVVSIAGIHRLWHECPSVMPPLLEAYITLLRDELIAKNGVEIRCEDDALLAVFALEVDAVQWAVAIQHHAMHLPYPQEILSMAEACAVPHPSMLGASVTKPSPLAFEEGRVAPNLDATYLQKWTWRGFRLRVALHSGSICVHPEEESDPENQEEISIGGSHVGFVAKMGLWAPAGAIVASSSFVQALETQLSLQAHLQGLASTLSFVKWEEVPAPLDDKNMASDKNSGSESLEALVCVVPDILKHRGAVALTSHDNEPSKEDGTSLPPLGSMMQRWACGFMHQVDCLHRGRLARLAFIVVEVESAKHFPHYNGSMLNNASKLLIEQFVDVAERRGGACFAITAATVVVTFESPIVAAQFALYLQLEALQFSSYPHELLLIPSCKEQYEESALTWRGLRVRTVGHFGAAGVVLRHLSTRQLEYFGASMVYANELSQSAPFGCFSCSASFFNEVSGCLDVLEDPVTLDTSTSELTFLVPRFLFRRDAAIRSYVEQMDPVKAKSSFAHHDFQMAAFEEKRSLPEYSSGIKTSGDVQRMLNTEDYGILAVTQHSILDLWKEEEALREQFEARLAAAIEEADASGGSRVGKRLPTRRDCRNDVLSMAQAAAAAVEDIVTRQFGGFVAAESKAAFLTNVFVFPNIGAATRCAMHLQTVISQTLQPHVPESVKDRLDRVFSAETGQIVMEGIRVGCALHCGRVNLVHSAGCRQWAYYGAALHQCADVAASHACPGETLMTAAAHKAIKQCGPSDLDGVDADTFLAAEVVLQPLLQHMLAAGDEPPRLVGELVELNLLSILPSSHAERLAYFLRRPHDPYASSEKSVGQLSTQRDNEEMMARRRARQRQMQSKYGFFSLHQLRKAALPHPNQRSHVDADHPPDGPSYLWNATLAQRLYRTAWQVVTKASRVMGYPLDFDVDPASFDASLREATKQTRKMVTAFTAGGDDVDFSDVLDVRAVLDDACAAVLQRSDENLNQVLLALGARLEKPLSMHRTMQSAIIIPPNEKDDSALYKGTADVGPGRRVTPTVSRPVSRERSGTPSTPTMPSSSTPLLGPDHVSVGTENPRFVSAGKRPNSRQRSSSPVPKIEQGTQPSPADVPALVAMSLPSALMVQEHHNWATPASLFRPGIGVDIATMRIKERRIMELEKEVGRLQEESRGLLITQSPDGGVPRLFGGTSSFGALARASSADDSRATPIADSDRSAALIGKLLDWQHREQTRKVSKHLALPPLEAPDVLHSTMGSRPSSSPIDLVDNAASGAALLDDDGVDFSVHRPPPAAVRHQKQQRVDSSPPLDEYDGALVDVPHNHGGTSSSYLTTLAGNYPLNSQQPPGSLSFTRHVPPSSRQHWRKTSPLAPLQSSYATTFQKDGGFLISGEVTSKVDLVAPFSSAAEAIRKVKAKSSSGISRPPNSKIVASSQHVPPAATPEPYVDRSMQEFETTIPSRPQSGRQSI